MSSRLKHRYLAAGELTAEPNERKGDGPITRRLKLACDVRQETVFTYIDVNYSVDHR